MTGHWLLLCVLMFIFCKVFLFYFLDIYTCTLCIFPGWRPVRQGPDCQCWDWGGGEGGGRGEGGHSGHGGRGAGGHRGPRHHCGHLLHLLRHCGRCLCHRYPCRVQGGWSSSIVIWTDGHTVRDYGTLEPNFLNSLQALTNPESFWKISVETI